MASVIAHLIVDYPRESTHWYWKHAAAASGLFVFLSGTAITPVRTCAKLGLFTLKLALATMIAALIRVREHWPRAFGDELVAGWRESGELLICCAPLFFMAAHFAHRIQAPGQLAQMAAWGLVFPLGAAILLAAFVRRAAYLTHSHLGSLAGFLSALNYGDARTGWAAKRLILGMTLFGVIRFSSWAIDQALPISRGRSPIKVAAFVLLAVVVGVAAGKPHPDWGAGPGAAACAVIAGAAVLTTDSLTGRFTQPCVRAVDWTGALAWLAGAAYPFPSAWSFPITGIFVGPDPMELGRWWSLAPSYCLSVGLCLAGRLIERALRRVR